MDLSDDSLSDRGEEEEEDGEEEEEREVVLDTVFQQLPLRVMKNTIEDEKHRYWCGCLPGREPADDPVEDEMQKQSSGWWIVLRLRKKDQTPKDLGSSDRLERMSVITTQQIEDVLSIGSYPRVTQKRLLTKTGSATQQPPIVAIQPPPPPPQPPTGSWSILSVIGPVEQLAMVVTIQAYWSKSSHRGVFGKIARGEAISRLLSISAYVNWELVLNINPSYCPSPPPVQLSTTGMTHIQKNTTTI
jgi:hypothetical protein